MAVIPVLMFPTDYLTTSSATYYTTPSGGAILKEIILANVTGSSAWARIHLVASGGSSALTNRIVSDAEIPAGATVIFTFSTVLVNGSTVRALAEAGSAITMTASGVTL